jgi:predicted glutamine amidotransferase
MCRMMAVRAEDPAVRQEVLRRFRGQASRGFTGPDDHREHRDGWGIVASVGGRLAYLGRSPADATHDPEYDAAVARAVRVDPGTFLLAHVRNASRGERAVRNCHPFVRDGWAFAHNGTVHALEAPPGTTPEGETDSERLFLHLLQALRSGRDVASSVAEVLEQVESRHEHSSLTFLLTNGSELHVLRRVGGDVRGCGTRACAVEHYTIGWSKYGQADIVLQEPQVLPGLEAWREIADGELLAFPARGPPIRRRVLASLPAAAD